MPASCLIVCVCELLTLSSMADVCFNAGDKLLKGFPLLTSVDWHTHQAAMADGRTGHFTDIFQTRGEHCTTMPTQSFPDLSPVYAPPRPQPPPSDQFFCNCRILIKSTINHTF